MESAEEAAPGKRKRQLRGGDVSAAAEARRPPLTGDGEPAILRLISPLAMLVVAATVACCVLGLVLARQADDYLEARHRQALRDAIEAVRAVSPNLTHVDPQLVRSLERASGFRALHFDGEAPVNDQNVQSLTDAKGRIIGWFSWEPERPATEMMFRLLPIGLLVGLGVFSFAVLAMWQLRRLGSLLAKSCRDVHKLAYEDAVTGLPNLHHLRDFLDRALAARGSQEILAIAHIDLGGFEDTKDTVGDAGEDQLLNEIADRLRENLPDGALVGRMRGDKFGLVMPATDPDAALAAMRTIREEVSRPLWIHQVVHVCGNVGMAMAPRDGDSREQLMRRADLALRAAKRRGRGVVMTFSPDMETEFDDRRFIKRELSRALAGRSFTLHYQPIVKADGGDIVGVEALLRWNHPTRGWISPADFVRVAEEAGLMDQLGEFVLRSALIDAARWPGIYVAVNLSPVQVRDRAFAQLIRELLEETKTVASRLVLEITEGVVIDDPLTTKVRLQDLRALGVRLALDDFGSGYSSLAYLQRLPFDKLKIDRGFVAALDHSANTGVIIQAIVTLGKALGMSVVIEGVETEEQRVLLRLAGCTEMQGYLFSQPVAREQIDRLLSGEPAAEPPPARRAG